MRAVALALSVTAASACVAAGCGGGGGHPSSASHASSTGPTGPRLSATMALTSPAFPSLGALPARFTCDGLDISPPLGIGGTPLGTSELALVLHDVDANGFLHWVVFAIPPDVVLIREDELPPNALQATTGFGPARYGGPCPPRGRTHHYVFELYAERTRLSLEPGGQGPVAVQAIEAGASAKAVLIGTYRRAGS